MESEHKVENFDEFSDEFEKTKSDEIKQPNQLNGGQMNHQSNKENGNPNVENKENVVRRHDEPSELSFEICKRSEKVLLLFRWIDEFINIFITVALCMLSSRKPRRKDEKETDRRGP